MPKVAANRVVLVTGASSGIGEAIAKRLAGSNYKVYGGSRSMRPNNNGIVPIRLDVADQASVDGAVAQILTAEGRLDILVNNAGQILDGAIEETSIAQAKELFETNFFGVMRLTQAVLPEMRSHGFGRIIHTGSVLGFLPAPFSGVYSATKHAIEGFSETLDHEVRHLGIRSVVVEPAFTATAIMAHLLKADRPLVEYALIKEHIAVAIEKAMTRADSPEVVADTVAAILKAKNPKVRYPAGSSARTLALLRRLLPASVFEKSFRKQFGLDAFKFSDRESEAIAR
jgi:NAD(P)-dependent dehydrogenase (short-subunit alcohol dehydrogenase family)